MLVFVLVAAAFTFEGYDRKNDSAFYFHISTEEIGVGGGLYNPMGDRLKNLRKAIDKPFDTALLHNVPGMGYRLAAADKG